MSYEKLLALYHFCNQYHSGQWSRLYRLSCKIGKLIRPAHSEEYSAILESPGYEESRAFYDTLVSNYEAKRYHRDI